MTLIGWLRFTCGTLARFSLPLLIACGGAAANTPASGDSLVELLQALTASGVDVLYSSELVPSSLAAVDSAPGTDLLTRVQQALANHQLELRPLGPRRYMVARVALPAALPAARAPAPAAVRSPALDEVTVFASRYAFSTDVTGQPIEFDAHALENVPGAQSDALRAARSAPGLASNLSARPYVRGAAVADVLVQYDDIPLIDPFHFRSFQSLLSAFDPASVGGARVFTGGFPVEYGTRSAGVIDLMPRSVVSGYEVDLGASRLSYNAESTGRAESLPIDWLIAARHSVDPNVLQPVEGQTGVPTFWDVVGRVGWHFEPGTALALGWLLQEDRVHLSSDSREEHATGASHDTNVWLRWDWALGGNWQSQSSLSVMGSERQSNGNLNLPGIVEGRLDDDRQVQNAALRSAWSYNPEDALNWKIGMEFVRENAALDFVKREFYSDLTQNSFGPHTPDVASIQAPHSATAAVYVAAHRRWQRFEAEAGLRLDAQDYRGYGVRSQLSPRLNLRRDLSSSWHTYASWGEFTQAQRVDEYRVEENQTTPDSANRAFHTIVGLAYEGSGRIFWRLEAYHDRWTSVSPYFDNALGAVSLLPELEPDRVRIAPSAATAKGVEISVQKSVEHQFSAWATYVVSSVADEVAGQPIARSWDQRNAVKLGATWAPARWSASALFTWHSGWPATPLTIIPETAAAPPSLVVYARNSANWGSYGSLDVRLSRSIPLPVGELSLWLDATNVTNRMNTCCLDLNSNTRADVDLFSADKIWSPREINVGFVWHIARP